MSHYAAVRLYLESAGTYPRTQAQITRDIKVSGPDMRKLANEHPQTFLGTNAGYKLVRRATDEELEDTLRVLMSRSEKIMHRARSLQRYMLERNRVTRRTIIKAVVGQ